MDLNKNNLLYYDFLKLYKKQFNFYKLYFSKNNIKIGYIKF